MNHISPYRTIVLQMLLLGLYPYWEGQVWAQESLQKSHGAIIRGDVSKKQLTLIFTGHEYAEGGEKILETLRSHKVPAAFFFTGDFYRNPSFASLIRTLIRDGHYLGAHSDKHLLYCDWEDRSRLLVSRPVFEKDLMDNYAEMKNFGVSKEDAPYFLPPYEWYNDSISQWTSELGFQLINLTHGTRSHADYTHPGMPNYVDSDTILESIWDYEQKDPHGLNGFMLLVHIGAGPERLDKFYDRLPDVITVLRNKGYNWVALKELIDK
ncbi:polysaccharide deacetylase family protein [Negadavirga shengliensis]|uniref:Polysaccharide deacetylase family protein n=1 Tax=Negadavirga shengliensis TaxID=1389218 RepID=A0ABV9SWA5_9BACT